ncbi:hypothetical protein D3C74_456820 [compost metagenome]
MRQSIVDGASRDRATLLHVPLNLINSLPCVCIPVYGQSYSSFGSARLLPVVISSIAEKEK